MFKGISESFIGKNGCCASAGKQSEKSIAHRTKQNSFLLIGFFSQGTLFPSISTLGALN